MTPLEDAISKAVTDGVLLDKRAAMPVGPGQWPTRSASDILGCCVHQNAGGSDPKITAAYHTSPDNHITPGTGLPSICYHIAVTDSADPPWLVAHPLWRTYAQGSKSPGDENTALLAVLVMGNFDGAGHKGRSRGPSMRQTASLAKAVAWAQAAFSFGDAGVFGHYHFGKAACPGSALQTWIEAKRFSAQRLKTPMEWQQALLRWDPSCLPRYGVDGDWGDESKRAIALFQRASGLQVTALCDPFTELVLLKKFGG